MASEKFIEVMQVGGDGGRAAPVVGINGLLQLELIHSLEYGVEDNPLQAIRDEQKQD